MAETSCTHKGLDMNDPTDHPTPNEQRIIDLEGYLYEILSAYENNSGYEPSVSVLGRAISEAKEYLSK